MLTRCRNKKVDPYPRYGGRGIKVCERWLKFENFYADMGECPDGLTLDRIDVNGNYEPANCRWATHAEQSRNQRTNRNITWKGKTMCLTDWAKELGLSASALHKRLSKLSLEGALAPYGQTIRVEE